MSRKLTELEKELRMDKRLEHEEIYNDLCVNVETMDENEWNEKYDSLPKNWQLKVDESMREFADNAIGDPSWRWGDDD